MSSPDNPAPPGRLTWDRIALLYPAAAFGVSFVLPAYQVTGAAPLAGWQVFRIALELLNNPRMEAGQRPLLALAAAANLAGLLAFALAYVRFWGRSTIAALVALGFGASCLLNPRLLVREFRVGYYVWLGSFALLCGIALWQWWQSARQRKEIQ
jgi:hypothetical protein